MDRCPWSSSNPLMAAYHDTEWGVPVYDDIKHFEFLTLESAQAGLSWSTILNRREGYRQAFEGFDPKRVAQLDEQRVEALMSNTAIVRNRQKIVATINNAKRFLEVQQEFGSFSKYIWSFVGDSPIVNTYTDQHQIPAKSPQAEALSKDLKRRGFKFLGPVTLYAHLQATGLVNDHLIGCPRHRQCQELSK